MKIRTESYPVEVHLTPDGASVWTQNEDRAVVRLVDDAADLLNEKPYSYRIIYPWVVLLALGLLALVGVAVSVLAMRSGQSVGGIAGLIVTGVVIVAYAGRLPISWRYRGAVELMPLHRRARRETSAAFRRQAAINVGSAIAGALLGALITLLLSNPPAGDEPIRPAGSGAEGGAGALPEAP